MLSINHVYLSEINTVSRSHKLHSDFITTVRITQGGVWLWSNEREQAKNVVVRTAML